MSLPVLVGSLLVYCCTELSTGSQSLLLAAGVELVALKFSASVEFKDRVLFSPSVLLKPEALRPASDVGVSGASPVLATAARATLVMAASSCSPRGVPTIMSMVPPGSARSNTSL
jgi:hypothetical protein